MLGTIEWGRGVSGQVPGYCRARGGGMVTAPNSRERTHGITWRTAPRIRVAGGGHRSKSPWGFRFSSGVARDSPSWVMWA